ncbi:MAG: DUF4126 domain-containing protein [Lapillicoccus sp.]
MVGTELLPWVFTTGWASGINAYLVVLILGIAQKVFHVSGVPDALGRTDVLVAAAVLFLLEMFADKIPYVDSFWDTAHTVIRPAVGATLGYLIGHESSSLEAAFGAATGGFSALAAHLVKAGTRAAVNTSPEPASNIIVSTGEDLTVAGVVSLAFLNPWVAASIAALILVAGALLVVFLLRRLRRLRALRQRYDDWGERNGLAPPSDRGTSREKTRGMPVERREGDTERLPRRP